MIINMRFPIVIQIENNSKIHCTCEIDLETTPVSIMTGDFEGMDIADQIEDYLRQNILKPDMEINVMEIVPLKNGLEIVVTVDER